jgi:CO/xanthine dehydrogenase FAD-binding subunit
MQFDPVTQLTVAGAHHRDRFRAAALRQAADQAADGQWRHRLSRGPWRRTRCP